MIGHGASGRGNGVAPVAMLGAALLALTAVITFTTRIHFAYISPEGHIALETAASVIALLAAYLAFARFHQSSALDDLALATGLTLLAVSNLMFAVLPALGTGFPARHWSWARVAGDLLGAAAFTASAFIPARTVRHPRRASRRALGAAVVLLGLLAATAAALHGLPAPIDPTLSPESSMRPRVVGNPVVESVQLVIALALAGAAAGFAREGRRRGDPLRTWLAVASTVGACSRVHYFLFPSLYSPWLHTGDAFRLAYYLLILVAALREIAAYQPRLAQAAVANERRRIARDLHDGLTQELAFVVGGLRSSAGEPLDPEEAARLLEAAEHGLAEARQAVVALSFAEEEPLGAAVARVAGALALRAGVELTVNAAPDIDAPGRAREAVLGITREAVTNALRHSGARGLVVTLDDDGDALHLQVCDDGAGFAVDAPRDIDTGFGLISMRERAELAGGALAIRSRPGAGTLVEAQLPR
jgi:signal transduction histidine kinase